MFQIDSLVTCDLTSNRVKNLMSVFYCLISDIFFDKDLEYKVAMGDTLSFTCSFQNLQDVNQLKITRGENKDVVMVLHRDGTGEQSLNHFVLSSSDWGDDYGSVTITANITCGDENRYTCETDSNSGEAVVLITVLGKYFTLDTYYMLYVDVDHVLPLCCVCLLFWLIPIWAVVLIAPVPCHSLHFYFVLY